MQKLEKGGSSSQLHFSMPCRCDLGTCSRSTVILNENSVAVFLPPSDSDLFKTSFILLTTL